MKYYKELNNNMFKEIANALKPVLDFVTGLWKKFLNFNKEMLKLIKKGFNEIEWPA